MVYEGEQLRGAAQSVHDLFTVAERRFRAPEFQRHYVWRADGASPQIRRFWEDFEQLRSDGADSEATLFLGAIVLQVVDSGGPGGVPLLSIIDGQQRILTIYLILAALADWYQTGGWPAAAGEIERRYLLNQASSIRDTPRVEPTLNDTKQFCGIMSCLQNPPPRCREPGFGPPDHHMTKAWRAIHRKVGHLARGGSGEVSLEQLDALRDDLLQRIEVVTITLGDRHAPHEVYERLNIGGEPLKPLDLIRNAVFLAVGSDQEAVERIYRRHWDPFEQDLGLQRPDKYLSPYGAIRDPSTNKSTLYPKLRAYWHSQRPPGSTAEEFGAWIIRDLREFVPAYRAISGEAKPSGLGPKAWAQVQRLQRMGAPEMTYPYLIRLVHAHLQGDVSYRELKDVIDVLDSFFLRRAFADLINTSVNQLFRTLWDASRQSVDGLKSRLDTRATRFPDDEQFARDIRTAAIDKSQRCKYILDEYERAVGGNGGSGLAVYHLMPPNPAPGAWPHVSDSDRRRLARTWANLVPLADTGTLRGAETWEEARRRVLDNPEMYPRSTLNVFRANRRWDAAAVERRAEELAAWALERWPKS